MGKTGVIISDKYTRHFTGSSHPESPQRISSIINTLEKLGFYKIDTLKFFEPLIALVTDVELVHPQNYISEIKSFCKAGGGALNMDTIASPETYKTALLAVGGALKAADLVLDGKVENSFAFIRPPGHHSGFSSARGFCFFNNIAIVAEYLHKKKNFNKILIVDVDVHHGNGTQEIFNNKDYVVYLSLHQDGRTHYPGTGFINDIGFDKGKGHMVNIPLPPGIGDESYINSLKEMIYPISEEFKPEIILVSWGFDTYYGDHLSAINLSPQSYSKITEILMDISLKYSNKKLVCVLEGGYNTAKLGYLAANILASMADIDYIYVEDTPPENPSIKKYMENLLINLKDNLRDTWKNL